MGKIQIIRVLGIISLCLYLVSCSKSKESNENIQEFQNVSKVLNKETIEEGKVAISLKDGLTDGMLVISGEEEDKMPSMNIKKENFQGLFYKDPVYNIIYYVNYGEDYFIYRLKDGKSELVVEMPAKRLFCLDGKLYFILESYDIYTLKDMEDGNILCYNPANGEVSMVSDRHASTMFVYDDGIYYLVETIIEDIVKEKSGLKTDLYYYSFATSTSESINDIYTTPYKWMDYHISHEVEEVEAGDKLYEIYGTEEIIKRGVGLKLEKLDKTRSIKLTDHTNISYYTMIGNKFYYILDRQTLMIFDIDSNITKEIPLAIPCGNDLTILNGMIYMDSLLQINPETVTQSIITPENNDRIIIYELYTDGENLYGLCGSEEGKEYGLMKRIQIEEFADKAMNSENDTGIPFEIGRFIFHTLPMGDK